MYTVNNRVSVVAENPNSPLNRPGFVGGDCYWGSNSLFFWRWSASNSAGGEYPQAECSRALLYQSTHSRVASSTSAIVRQGPSRLIFSVLNRPIVVSASA